MPEAVTNGYTSGLLMGGGLFLVAKSVHEMHAKLEGEDKTEATFYAHLYIALNYEAEGNAKKAWPRRLKRVTDPIWRVPACEVDREPRRELLRNTEKGIDSERRPDAS